MTTRMRRDDGMTLTELLISMMIFAVLMALVMAIMIQMLYMSRDNSGRVSAAQDARLGISQIDRQVRSGNVISDPALETMDASGVDPLYSLRIFTQEGGVAKCAQWRVIDPDADGFAELQYREWSPNYPADPVVKDWGVVAHNLVVTGESSPDVNDSSTWPPFWKDTSTIVEATDATPAQNVRITLHVKSPQMRASAKPSTISTVVTGRNTVLGYSESNCATVPDA